ncbi:MAG: molybdopterin cofactor-binding domain-containing protein [Gemmatimonadales bacterium]
MTTSVSRRDFLRAGAVAGAGLTIAVYLPGCQPGEGRVVTTPFKPNAWVRVSTDGSVLLITDRSEMGQGVVTSLPQLLAEELDVPWDRVRIEPAPADKAYYNSIFPSQLTGGSTSVRGAWKPLREAGAAARAMLVQAAAEAWGVPVSECRTENGVVLHPASRRRMPYGELAEAASRLPVPTGVAPKSPDQWRIIGTPAPRLDVPDKVTGRAVFGIDAGPNDALVAMVARSPVFGAEPVKWNEQAALAVAGVRRVVKLSTGIAVVADGYWAAHKGREALAVEWGTTAAGAFSMEAMRRDAARLARGRAHVAKRAGTGALTRGAKTVSAEYHAPYLAHACMEPMNATAHVEAGKCTVWAPTQYQCGPALGGGVQETAARIAGVDPAQVTVHTTLLGGGFGRRVMQDFVVEAVEASKAVGAPVKVIWSREDDIQHDFYRPPTFVQLAASLDEQGRPQSFTCRVVCPSIMTTFGAPKDQLDGSAVEALSDHPYAIPNLLVEAVHPDWPVPLGFWRSVGSSQNGFVIEGFIDELAWEAGRDPVEFRRGLLADAPRHRAVLDLAASRAGWGSPLPEGRGRGIALVKSFDSYVAEVAEVSLNPDRTIRVHRVVCAVDCGRVVNPDGVRAQVESAVVYGLTAALHGEITIEGGRVVQGNFHDYPMLRMREMPVVEVHLVESTEDPTGIGEPGTPPIAPAVANAVYALTRQRLRSLPFRAVPA